MSTASFAVGPPLPRPPEPSSCLDDPGASIANIAFNLTVVSFTVQERKTIAELAKRTESSI